jgi:hypothetical protein
MEPPSISLFFRQRRAFLLPFRHWLLQSMISTSLPERQVAFRVLAQGCPLDESSIWTCIELLCSVVYSETTYLWMEPFRVVACIAVLKHIVVNVMPDNERLGFCRWSRTGLTPMCETLRTLALKAKHEQGSQVTLRACFSFVDLLHFLVLKGRSESVHGIHKILWSTISEGQSISPLACLVATYQLWKDFPKDILMENYLGLLGRLVDPSVLPDICSGESVIESSRPVGRLAATFRSSKGKGQLALGKSDQKDGPNNFDLSRREITSASTVGDLSTQESPIAAAFATILESSPENRYVMELVSRLIGSLYGSNNFTRQQQPR